MKQKLIRLPAALAAVVCAVLNERLAGGEEDFRDALGLSDAEAARKFRQLEDAKTLIYDAQEIESREHVVTVFTLAEARELWTAAGNSVGRATDAADRIALLGSPSAVRSALNGFDKLGKAFAAVENLKLAPAPSRALNVSVEDEEANREVRFAGAEGSDRR